MGSPTLVRIDCLPTKEQTGYMFIEVVDGDGVPVRYFYPQHIHFQANETTNLEWVFRAGRGDAEAHLYWVDSPQEIKISQERPAGRKLLSFFPAELSQPLPSNQPWIVEIGDLRLGLEKGFASRSFLPRYSTSTISDVADLPNDLAAYQGTDLIALCTSDLSLVQAISENKQRAITEHVRGGGRFFIALGKNSLEVGKLPWIADLLPGPIRTVVPNVNASTIESMIGTSKQRLDALPMPILQLTRGVSDFSITLPDRQRVQVISRSGMGLGQVVTFSADLNLPPISEWEDRPALIQRLLQNQWVVQDQEQGVNTAASNSYLGYDDLFGQLRASLDVFPEVQNISFSYLSVLLILLLFILGPIEFYIWIRGINRSGWTWLSLVVVVAVSSGLIIRQYDQWKPKQPLVRGVEVIDIDGPTGYQRGRVWFHTYNASPAQLNVVADVKTVGQGEVRSSFADWQPLPGRGIGSLESGIRSLEPLPPYIARLSPSLISPEMTSGTSSLFDIPFPASGTKSLRVDWTGQSQPLDFGRLREIAGSGMLQGEFKNNLDIELLDGIILYHNLVYVLPAKMKPGESEKFTVLSTPKDLERRLTRRVSRDGKDITAPWNPADRNVIPLLMEMIFFYEAAGGEKYTQLQHRFEPSLDMSDLLSLDRAILLARVRQSEAVIKVTAPNGETSYQPESSTYIRCLIPISRANQ
ncbi:MAG: hypothetical protein J0M26_12595 [Planctomycetes bacterium]|nr:hypothetical protein [Planctomycetota bacterium]